MEDLKKLTGELGISESVVFTGNVKHEDVFTYISLMDVTVLPRTSWYMSPIKIFEYGAMGKAIVAPDNAPVKDVMVHEKDGVLIEPNAEAIGQAILRLYKDGDLRKRVATQFQQKVCSTYTWENTARRILEGFI